MTKRIITNVDIISINFVPDYYEADDSGQPVTGTYRMIGQLAYPFENLPPALQTQIAEIILRDYQRHGLH